MLAANNQTALYEYITPLVIEKVGKERWQEMVNSQNSTGNTPLRKIILSKTTLLSLTVLKC